MQLRTVFSILMAVGIHAASANGATLHPLLVTPASRADHPVYNTVEVEPAENEHFVDFGYRPTSRFVSPIMEYVQVSPLPEPHLSSAARGPNPEERLIVPSWLDSEGRLIGSAGSVQTFMPGRDYVLRVPMSPSPKKVLLKFIAWERSDSFCSSGFLDRVPPCWDFRRVPSMNLPPARYGWSYVCKSKQGDAELWDFRQTADEITFRMASSRPAWKGQSGDQRLFLKNYQCDSAHDIEVKYVCALGQATFASLVGDLEIKLQGFTGRGYDYWDSRGRPKLGYLSLNPLLLQVGEEAIPTEFYCDWKDRRR